MEQASPGYFGLKNLQQSLLQGLGAQQQMQAGQRAQDLHPLQKQLLQAQIGQQEAKTAALPQQTMGLLGGRELKQALDIHKAVSEDPALLQVPGMAQKADEANKLISQHQFMQQQQMQQVQQQGMQPEQMQQQPFGQEAPQQQAGENDVGLNYADTLMLRDEHKNTPADLKNQQIRSTSAKVMSNRLRGQIERLKPFFGAKNSLSAAFRSYATNKGLSDDKSAREYNTLKDSINSLAGEVTAGMSKSRAESIIREWQGIVDPTKGTTTGYDQVIQNLDNLGDILDVNHEALFQGAPVSKRVNDKFIKDQTKRFNERTVSRGTESKQNMITAPDGQQYSVEDLQKIAYGGQ
jgi:uncharacterized protein YfiM (DUF2279 family)